MEAALGTETISAGTKVEYTPALTIPSFSLCFKEGHTTHFVSGCVVESLSVSIEAKGAMRVDASGRFKKVLHAGSEETTTGSTTTVINLDTGGAKLFDVGAYIQVGSDDNTGAGYEITEVNLGSDTITVGTALSGAPAEDVLVKGFLPAASLSGYVVEGSSGSLTLGGTSMLVTSGSITVANQVKMIEEEVTGDTYPSGFTSGPRSITGELNCFFRRTYASLFKQATNNTQAELVLDGGDTGGKKIKVELDQAVVDTPEISGEEFQREMKVIVTGLATSSGEDEIIVTYI